MSKRKHKLEVRSRHEMREFDHKLPENYDEEAMAVAMEGADWSDDPGTGRAIHTPDGREILNPLPVAPPASILAASKEPSVNELVERALKNHFEQLKADEEIDTVAEMDEFGEDQEWHPGSMFEVLLLDEAPGIPKDVSPEAVAEVVKAEAELPPVEPVKA